MKPLVITIPQGLCLFLFGLKPVVKSCGTWIRTKILGEKVEVATEILVSEARQYECPTYVILPNFIFLPKAAGLGFEPRY